MTNKQFVSRYRKYGKEQPYWKADIFRTRLPFVYYKWSAPEMVQAVFMYTTCLDAIPVLQEVLGVSYGVTLSIVIINGFFYNLRVLLGDPMVPGRITPTIPIITAFLTDGYKMGPERTRALVTMQLIPDLIFLTLGITGIGDKMVHLVSNSVKTDVLMNGGLAVIIGEMGEAGCFWTYPIPTTVGVLVAYFRLFSPVWANLRQRYKAVDLIGKFGMLPAAIIGVVPGPIVKEIAVPAVQLRPLIKILKFSSIWSQLSPFAIGWSSAATWIATIPTAIVVYIIAFGDFITSEELLCSADKVHQNKKIDFSVNRSNVISGIRNVAVALCCPYTQIYGPLWMTVTAAVSQRYKEGPKTMEFVYSGAGTFHWYTFICVVPIPTSSLLQPVLPIALSLILIIQGFICAQLAMNMCHTDTEQGICDVMGAVLAIQGAAWEFTVSLILLLILFEGKKKTSEQVTIGVADDKANQ